MLISQEYLSPEGLLPLLALHTLFTTNERFSSNHSKSVDQSVAVTQYAREYRITFYGFMNFHEFRVIISTHTRGSYS